MSVGQDEVIEEEGHRRKRGESRWNGKRKPDARKDQRGKQGEGKWGTTEYAESRNGND